MIRRPPRSTQSRSSAASDVYKRQRIPGAGMSPVWSGQRGQGGSFRGGGGKESGERPDDGHDSYHAGGGAAADPNYPGSPCDLPPVRCEYGGDRGHPAPGQGQGQGDERGAHRAAQEEPSGAWGRDKLARRGTERLPVELFQPDGALLRVSQEPKWGDSERTVGGRFRRDAGERLLRGIQPDAGAPSALLGAPATGHPRAEGEVAPGQRSRRVGQGGERALPAGAGLGAVSPPSQGGATHPGSKGFRGRTDGEVPALSREQAASAGAVRADRALPAGTVRVRG